MARVFDIVLSGLALAVLSPLLLPVMLVLKFSGEGEIFFVQERIGRRQKPFKLLKFATMLKDSPNIGTGTVTMKNDPRVLPVGAVLRKTKINELPQLLNVLWGHMSLIGPRPQTERTLSLYSVVARDVITKVRPGLSGIGSILFRDEESVLVGRSATLDFYDRVIGPYKGDVEAWYVERQTIFGYFALICITVWVVLIPNTDIVWKVFRDLPTPPAELAEALNFPHN